MNERIEDHPLDTRLLSDAIIELNISRHNVSIYPENHPIVEKSLDVSFGYLQKLFELRREITLAVAKDTLIIDDCSLDKQNPIYREFALTLSNMNIVYVTFISGLTKKELYDFHSFILQSTSNVSSADIESVFEEYNLQHIKTAFIDYSAFSMSEGETEEDQGDQGVSLSERYLVGILEGKLPGGAGSEFIQDMPPDKLASLINAASSKKLSEDSYDKVITSYVRTSSERAFTAKEMKKLMDFINNLKPELKRQFLTSAVNNVSKDMDSVKNSIGNMEVDEVIDMVGLINEQMVAMPKALKSLLDKFSDLHSEEFETPCFEGKLIEDDILLSSDAITLLNEANYTEYISDSYQEEIQGLSNFNTANVNPVKKDEFEEELELEFLENAFHQVILEIVSYENYNDMPAEEHKFFVNFLNDKMEKFVETGQYIQILGALRAFKSNYAKNRFRDLADEALKKCSSSSYIASFLHSLSFFGKEKRAEVIQICEFYGEKMIAPMIDALAEEKSLKIRKLLLRCIELFGDKAAAEAVKRLSDNRWYVQRNMLFILSKCGSRETIQLARLYCDHSNPTVSFEAIRCLLNIQDDYPVQMLRYYLTSGNRGLIMKTVSIVGTFKVKEIVPDLIQLLHKKNASVIDYIDQVAVIRALGQIGDSSALDTLESILTSKTLLYKSYLEKLKKEILISLKQYDPVAVEKIMANIRSGKTPL